MRWGVPPPPNPGNSPLASIPDTKSQVMRLSGKIARNESGSKLRLPVYLEFRDALDRETAAACPCGLYGPVRAISRRR
jgi:hypothetical protein